MRKHIPASDPSPRMQEGVVEALPKEVSADGQASLVKDSASSPAVTPKVYTCTVPGTPKPLALPFAAAIKNLEARLQMPIWLLVQNDNGKFGSIDCPALDVFRPFNGNLPKKPIGLLIDSPGGSAKCAYQIAMSLRHHCGAFTAIVPRHAKSAATLLALGADRIILGKYAELGPLDAQITDPDREERVSALDEVQALERLHAFALEALDRSMFLMLVRTSKKVDSLLPTMGRFVTDMMRPMLEKIDAVHYTQMSRALKVAEEYAIRLLQPKYTLEGAQKIARHLVQNYPEHGFVVDGDETAKFGLLTEKPVPEVDQILDQIVPYLATMTAIGYVQEQKNDPAKDK